MGFMPLMNNDWCIMKKIFLSLLLICTTQAFSANAPAKAVVPAGPEKRTYTEEEFKKAVMIEAEKIMKKAGSGHLVDFSKELLDKEDAIKIKELNIQKEQEQLKLNINGFQKKVVEFQESQKKFLGCIDSQNDMASKRITQMVEVIAGMKPQSAADVLSVQDPDLSVRILGQLEAQKASKIFNLMDKEVSARLQKQFLQMKK
jgi:flagellar motility protein MotE (MotC chaperone)